MVENVSNAYFPTDVSPPGETLRELLEERGIAQADLAVRMGRPKKTVSEIVNGKAAITPETALELELVLGVPATFWNARERDYRTWLARREQEQRFAHECEWAKLFPLRAMTKLGWLPSTRDKASQVRSLLEFLGVNSSEQWSEIFRSYQVAFRHSTAFKSDVYALSAWLRAGASYAERVNTRRMTVTSSSRR
jgi:HTH-type transcriptional regulator / antitoxin HigA